MKQFTPMQYLAIDVANHFGLDKKPYEDRIKWVKDNINDLEYLQQKAEEPILYAKAVKALRDTQQGVATGHAVAFDSVCSGLQLMSVLTNCPSGMAMTGLSDRDDRPDAYTEITDYMNQLMQADGIHGVSVSRKQAKEAIMTGLYGSQAVPKRVFGEELLLYFYKALDSKCGGAVALLEYLRRSHQEIDVQSWLLPDGHTAYVPSMVKKETRVNVSELNYSAVAIYYEQEAVEYSIANIANVVHSVDAFVLRELVRRCSYHKGELKTYLRMHYNTQPSDINSIDSTFWITERYNASKFASMGFIEHISYQNIRMLPNELRKRLASICELVLNHVRFDVITIHDSFACHANHMQTLRQHYNEILVQLYESEVLNDLLSQLYQEDLNLDVGERNLSETIRQSNYGIC